MIGVYIVRGVMVAHIDMRVSSVHYTTYMTNTPILIGHSSLMTVTVQLNVQYMHLISAQLMGMYYIVLQ